MAKTSVNEVANTWLRLGKFVSEEVAIKTTDLRGVNLRLRILCLRSLCACAKFTTGKPRTTYIDR